MWRKHVGARRLGHSLTVKFHAHPLASDLKELETEQVTVFCQINEKRVQHTSPLPFLTPAKSTILHAL